MTAFCSRFIVLLLVLAIFGNSMHGLAGEFEDAVANAALQVNGLLKEQNESRISAKFQGFGNLPGGNEVGFIELFRNALAEHGKVLTKRANLSFEARLVRTDPEGSDVISTELIGQLIDQRGNSVGNRIQCYPSITSPAELAQQSGVSSQLIATKPSPNGFDPAQSFRRAYDAQTVHAANDGHEIYSNEDCLFGVAVVVGKYYRRIGEPAGSAVPEGLAYTSLQLGEEYTIELINNSNHECAIEVKVDGLRPFHFADDSIVKPDGEKPKFFVVAPRSRQQVRGWVLAKERLSRFLVTPLQESAVMRAGVSTENVGMVSLTFHACWTAENAPPANEPLIVLPSRPKIQYRTVERKRRRDDGTIETYTEQIPEMQTSSGTATGFGTEESTDLRGVTRKIGVPRAVVAFRYNR